MPFAPPEITQSLEATGGTTRYLNIAKIDEREPVRFALLTEEPLWFYEVWGEDLDGSNPKPFRFSSKPTEEDVLQEMGGSYKRREVPEKWGGKPGEYEQPKLTCAVPIYNHNVSAVQVLSIKQVTIQRELNKISQIEEYSDLTEWDLRISVDRVGERPTYSLTPIPRKRGSDSSIKKAWEEAESNGFDVNRLLNGEDPFGDS